MNDTTQDNPITQAAQVDMIPGPLAPFPGLDFTKPLRCKGPKYAVRILAIDNSLTKPIVGVIVGCMDKDVSAWHINGQYNPNDTTDHPDYLDLENYTPATEASR